MKNLWDFLKENSGIITTFGVFSALFSLVIGVINFKEGYLQNQQIMVIIIFFILLLIMFSLFEYLNKNKTKFEVKIFVGSFIVFLLLLGFWIIENYQFWTNFWKILSLVAWIVFGYLGYLFSKKIIIKKYVKNKISSNLLNLFLSLFLLIIYFGWLHKLINSLSIKVFARNLSALADG